MKKVPILVLKKKWGYEAWTCDSLLVCRNGKTEIEAFNELCEFIEHKKWYPEPHEFVIVRNCLTTALVECGIPIDAPLEHTLEVVVWDAPPTGHTDFKRKLSKMQVPKGIVPESIEVTTGQFGKTTPYGFISDVPPYGGSLWTYFVPEVK